MIQRANEARTCEGNSRRYARSWATSPDIKRSSRNGVISRERHQIMRPERNDLSDVLFSFLPSFLSFNLSRSHGNSSGGGGGGRHVSSLSGWSFRLYLVVLSALRRILKRRSLLFACVKCVCTYNDANCFRLLEGKGALSSTPIETVFPAIFPLQPS